MTTQTLADRTEHFTLYVMMQKILNTYDLKQIKTRQRYRSNGDDNIALIVRQRNIIDIFNVPSVDGSETA